MLFKYAYLRTTVVEGTMRKVSDSLPMILKNRSSLKKISNKYGKAVAKVNLTFNITKLKQKTTE